MVAGLGWFETTVVKGCIALVWNVHSTRLCLLFLKEVYYFVWDKEFEFRCQHEEESKLLWSWILLRQENNVFHLTWFDSCLVTCEIPVVLIGAVYTCDLISLLFPWKQPCYKGMECSSDLNRLTNVVRLCELMTHNGDHVISLSLLFLLLLLLLPLLPPYIPLPPPLPPSLYSTLTLHTFLLLQLNPYFNFFSTCREKTSKTVFNICKWLGWTVPHVNPKVGCWSS